MDANKLERRFSKLERQCLGFRREIDFLALAAEGQNETLLGVCETLWEMLKAEGDSAKAGRLRETLLRGLDGIRCFPLGFSPAGKEYDFHRATETEEHHALRIRRQNALLERRDFIRKAALAQKKEEAEKAKKKAEYNAFIGRMAGVKEDVE
ncbi:MAG: hypothetical protein IAE94_01825 [Chthoniobacterales bacterium]|nr:hypothetical protein [Chthoniobacterales bacterium]